MGKGERDVFVKLNRFGASLVGRYFQMDGIFPTNPFLRGLDQAAADPPSPELRANVELLNFGNFTRMMQQVLDMATDKPDGCPFDLRHQVMNLGVGQIVQKDGPKRRLVQFAFFQFTHKLVHNINILPVGRANFEVHK